jgi:fatty acid desaturase
MKPDNDSIRVRKDFRVKWYRPPVDKFVLQELHERSDIKGYFQTLGHLGLLTCTGALTAVLFVQEQWTWFFIALWFHGSFGSMIGAANHELGHRTVFKTRSLNLFFLRVTSLLTWWNYHEYSMSHTFHHRNTLHTEGDREVQLPKKPSLQFLLLLQLFTFNFQNLTFRASRSFLTACGRFSTQPLRAGNDVGATQWHQALAEVYPEKQKDAVRWARIVLGFHGSIILVTFIFQVWWLAIVISGFAFIGNWLGYFVNVAQHGGLRDNVPDFRLCARTIHLNPLFEFLYWRMNYHAEHHMYAGVPCYNLKRLSQVIAEDMPERKTLIGAWREMRETMKRQQTEPEYQFSMPLPSTAHPGVTAQSALPKMQNKQDDHLAASIGDLAPEEEALDTGTLN